MESSAQDFGQTQFICTSVPKDMDLCTASMQNSGPAEDLKTTIIQLRETVLQQKETIVNQKETIRELTSKLSRCESQSLPAAAGPGGRRPGSKNTMGDVSRGTTETLAQLGQTLQTLKQRLENLEVGEGHQKFIEAAAAGFRKLADAETRWAPFLGPHVCYPRRRNKRIGNNVKGGDKKIHRNLRNAVKCRWSHFNCVCSVLQQYSRGNNSAQANSLKDLLQNKIDDMERQVLSRVNTLEESKPGARNESEQRNRVESTLTSLHHRITDLEKGA